MNERIMKMYSNLIRMAESAHLSLDMKWNAQQSFFEVAKCEIHKARMEASLAQLSAEHDPWAMTSPQDRAIASMLFDAADRLERYLLVLPHAA
jgi:uncharacterized protein with beta-barrel porin domain